jgi:hypothetical protein
MTFYLHGVELQKMITSESEYHTQNMYSSEEEEIAEILLNLSKPYLPDKSKECFPIVIVLDQFTSNQSIFNLCNSILNSYK